MPKGMEGMTKRREERAQARTGLQYLRLSDREASKLARIRFLTDKTDMVWGCFHRVPQKGRLGKDFWRNVYCVPSSEEENQFEECLYCSQVGEDVASVVTRMFFWVYVYEVYHTRAVSNDWQEEDYLGKSFYVESVNAVKLLETGPGKDYVIENRIDGWYNRFKTLLDRDYDWVREGTGLNTVYDLMPRDKGPISKEIKEAAEGLESLEDIIDKFKTKPKQQEDASEETKQEPESEEDLEKEIENIFGTAEEETGKKGKGKNG